MKINNFRGELTDNSAKKEALALTWVCLCSVMLGKERAYSIKYGKRLVGSTKLLTLHMVWDLRFWQDNVLPRNFRTLSNLTFVAGNLLALLFHNSSSSSDSSEVSLDTDDDNDAFDNVANPLEGHEVAMKLPGISWFGILSVLKLAQHRNTL